MFERDGKADKYTRNRCRGLMIYVLVERKLLQSTSWKGMVRLLKNISFDKARNKKEYMFNVAERVYKLYEHFIDNYNFEGFVRALDKLNIIHIQRCSDCEHFCINIRVKQYYCFKGIKKNFDPKTVICPFMNNKLIRKLRMIYKTSNKKESSCPSSKQSKRRSKKTLL